MSNVRWLFKVITPIKWGFMLGLFLVMLMTVFNLLMTGVQKIIIDDIFVKQQYDLLWPVLLLFLTSVLLYCASHFIGEMILNIHSRRSERWLLNKYMKVIHMLPTSIYQNERIGRFTSFYSQDIITVTSMFNARGIFSKSVQTISSFVILFAVIGIASPIILIGILFIGLIYIPMGKYFAPNIRAISKDMQEKRTDLNVHLVEGISSTREVIAFNRLKWEQKILDKLFHAIFQASMREVKIGNKQVLFSETLRTGTNFLVLAYGGYLVIQDNLSLGMFIIIYQYSNQFMTSVNGIYSLIMELPGLSVAINRLRRVMEEDIIKPGHLKVDENIQKVEFRDVCFRYSRNTPIILKNFSLTLTPNQKIAFVGTSGSGKSTLAQLLIRFYEPNAGEIIVNGRLLSDIEQESWVNKVSISFQEPYIFPESIKTNLLLGRKDISEENIVEACKNACIHDEILKLPNGYETVLGERGITLSGGQKQRLALARAILRDSEILILDEATSALDLQTERKVMKNLDTLRKNRITIIIAHRLSTVMNADLICVMEKGNITEIGTHAELIAKNNTYTSLISFQDKNNNLKLIEQ